MELFYLGRDLNLLKPKKKQYYCGFKAPDKEHQDIWKKYSNYVQDLGLDVCRVTIGMCEAFLKGEEIATIKTPKQVVNLQMNNQFLYQVQKPRRTPYSLNVIKPEFRRTFSSILFESYVLIRANELNRSFCFRDFLEIKHSSFRRIIIRLKRKGKIIAHPIRTNPRFYILVDRIKDYDTKKILKKP